MDSRASIFFFKLWAVLFFGLCWAGMSIAKANAQFTSYHLTDLGTFTADTSSSPNGINNSGDIVGESNNLPFLWDGSLTTMPPINQITTNVTAISDTGLVTGQWLDVSTLEGFIYNIHTGTLTPIGFLSASHPQSTGLAINNNGDVAGFSAQNLGFDDYVHAFLYKNGVMTDLGVPSNLVGALLSVYATGLNDSDVVVGYVQGNSDLPPLVHERAVIFQNNTISLLGDGFDDLRLDTSEALAINDVGQVVGFFEPGQQPEPFLWQNGAITDLGLLTGAISAIAEAINSLGHIVGNYDTSSGGFGGFLYLGGVYYDLSSLLDSSGSGIPILGASGINGSDQVAAVATINGQTHAVLLTPNTGSVPLAPADLTATADNAEVSLSWNAPLGATSYNIYRGTSSGTETLYQSGITTANFSDTAATNGTTYYYKVTAVDATGEGAKSNEASATPNASIPLPPTGLIASPGDAQVQLGWAASSGATSYNIYRSTSPGAETLYQSNVTSTSYTDTGAVNATTYYYEVTAVNGGGESGKSNEASATPELPAPTFLFATPGNAQVTLSWTGSAGATSYNIYRSTTSGNETLYKTGITAGYTDTGVVNGTTYFYEVTAVSGVSAVSGALESSKSNEAKATLVPSAPTNLMAAGSNSQVVLNWSASTGATSYNVYRGTSSGAEALYQSGITNDGFTDTAVTIDNTYFYEVTAVNSAGESGKSNEASAAPFAQIVYQAGLQMISSPYSYPGVALSTLFGYANPTLAVWSPASNQYAITPTAPADQISLGQGYWVRFPQVVTTTVPGTPAPTNQNFDIPLAQGWNMIGDPFLVPVPVANLLFANGTETFAQATTGNNPLIGATVWGYPAGSASYTPATSAVPQQGYWIFAFSATDVQVPHP